MALRAARSLARRPAAAAPLATAPPPEGNRRHARAALSTRSLPDYNTPVDTAKIKRSARALVGKVDLLGALEKLGFPDDPAGIKAHAFDLAEDQWEANEHRALGGVVGFGASFMV